MACPECKKSILNKTRSSIPNPACENGDCDESVDCDGVSISTDCITVNTALDCSDTEVGDTLSDVLDAIDTRVCTAVNGTVKVSISEPDTCPGYLENKIEAGDGIEITKETGVSGCQNLLISETCWGWNNILPSGTGTGKFQNGWSNVNLGYQVGAYSNVKECTVKFKGYIYNPSALAQPLIFKLPSTDSDGNNMLPSSIRVFHISIASSVAGRPIVAAIMEVRPTGDVTIIFNSTSTVGYVSLEGISYDV